MSNGNWNNRNHRDYPGKDYHDNEGNKNWGGKSRNSDYSHQGNWNNGERILDKNYGLGDTSQGSENYGHVDHGHGARFYGTGNYGGYFGGGGDTDRPLSRHHQNQGRGDDYREYFENKNLSSKNGQRHNYQHTNDGPGRYNSRLSADWNQGRNWWDRTSDEVSAWFGDERAYRRREKDENYGPHYGKGPKGYIRSDARIKEDIDERLYWDSFIDASDIEVSVTDGDVILSGTVDSKETKRRVEDSADTVSGVKDVSNQLKINHS